MNEKDLCRLNELAKQKKIAPLSIAEAAEYEQLKKVYLHDIKANLKRQLDEADIKRKE